MDLSIIIVNWNSAGYLEKCLETVYENTQGVQFEVIVVDNASFDGCREMLETRFPMVTFIQSGANLGFSGANNLGFERSSGRALLFLNPDTEVVGNALDVMLRVLNRSSKAGIVGARVLNSDRTIQTSCVQRFPSILNQTFDAELLRNLFPKAKFWGTRPLFEKQQGPVAVEMITGACLLIKRELFEEVRGFSTEYFMYSEDVDLCYKARRAGYENYYVDDAIVVHHGGGSSATADQKIHAAIAIRKSLLTFFILRHGRLYAAVYRVTVAIAAVMRCALLKAVLLGSRQNARAQKSMTRWSALFQWAIGMK
jgi:GT2 family glycosyltransferase